MQGVPWIRSGAGAQCKKVCGVKVACVRISWLTIILKLSCYCDAFGYIRHGWLSETRPDQSSRSSAESRPNSEVWTSCGAAGQGTAERFAAPAHRGDEAWFKWNLPHFRHLGWIRRLWDLIAAKVDAWKNHSRSAEIWDPSCPGVKKEMHESWSHKGLTPLLKVAAYSMRFVLQHFSIGKSYLFINFTKWPIMEMR